MAQRGSGDSATYLVKWRGASKDRATWEPALLTNCQAFFGRGGAACANSGPPSSAGMSATAVAAAVCLPAQFVLDKHQNKVRHTHTKENNERKKKKKQEQKKGTQNNGVYSLEQ